MEEQHMVRAGDAKMLNTGFEFGLQKQQNISYSTKKDDILWHKISFPSALASIF